MLSQFPDFTPKICGRIILSGKKNSTETKNFLFYCVIYYLKRVEGDTNGFFYQCRQRCDISHYVMVA